MTRTIPSFLIVTLVILISSAAHSSSVKQEILRIAGETAALELGFGTYHLGKVLTEEQKQKAETTPIDKALRGTYKFKDEDLYVVASLAEDRILGLYKEYPEISMDELKGIIGGLMFDFGEPTTMAHNKLIYWSYNKNGKISQDEFEFARQNGGSPSLVTVKFSSSELIDMDTLSSKEAEKKENEEKMTSAYVIISSDPLSKLFLAQTEQADKK